MWFQDLQDRYPPTSKAAGQLEVPWGLLTATKFTVASVLRCSLGGVGPCVDCAFQWRSPSVRRFHGYEP
jgi:hypothetical protein